VQNDKILKINTILKKKCFRTFVHTPFGWRCSERTFVLDCGNAQRVWNAD